MNGIRIFAVAIAGLATMLSAGCVRRTIAITSTPADAMVYVNDREVGRTPCEVSFLFYGEYDVRLKHDGYESIVGSGTASAPIWDFIGADLVAEVAPVELESRVDWHFDFIPAKNDHSELLARARQLQTSAQVEPDQTAEEEAGAAKRAAEMTAPPTAPVQREQGAIPPKGSSAMPVPPTELPSNIPGVKPPAAPAKP